MMDFKPPRLRSRWTSDLFDRLALLIVQPGVAVLALVGLATNSEAASDVSRPLFIWGGLALTCLVFAEGIWSFAARHVQKRQLGLLWIKLVGAGVCAVLVFASAYKHLGLVDEGRLVHDAGAALYFSVTAWTTVGYGDVLATPLARPFAAVEAVVGMIYNSALLGLVIYASTTNRARSAGLHDGSE
jgi:hypothetical protein